jgi:hypothetical protein
MRWRGASKYTLVILVAAGWVFTGTTSAWAGSCPNEALRSELRSVQLPDCRAYERVTPGYTESSINTELFAVSPEGNHVIDGSLGVFAGAAGDGLGNGTNLLGAAYELSRFPSTGWGATSITPPSSLFNSNGMFDASANLDATLWELGKHALSITGQAPQQAQCPPGPGEEAQPLGVSDLYIEKPVGIFTRIGPATPSPCTINTNLYDYRGASDDLSHILFSDTPSVRWTFDPTVAGGGTLYEYAGVEHAGETREPLLVGVEGARGSRTLISECGTQLGSSSPEEFVNRPATFLGSTYNAVSASGARIFFTAVGATESGGEACKGPPVSELFDREEIPLNEGELPAADMRTVPISEPTTAACVACLMGEELKAAVFEGASMDGSKVFFITEQHLLAGVEGSSLYEYNFDAPEGDRVSLISSGVAKPEVQGVARISEDGSHVFFVAKGDLAGAAKNSIGNSAVMGGDNLYMCVNGQITFIATLSSSDGSDWSRADSRPVLASGNDRFLVFTSRGDLTDEGLEGEKPQIFQYNVETDTLMRASIGEDGYNDDDMTPVVGSAIVNELPVARSYKNVDSPASANGIQAPSDGAVFFSSPDALTAGALDDQLDSQGTALVPNVYEYHNGQVYLLSDGHDISTVYGSPGTELAGSDPSGEDVFFFTSDPLIPADENTQQDIYDARVDSGFPTLAPSSGCDEESKCQGSLTTAPGLAPFPQSVTQAPEAMISPTGSSLNTPATTTPRPKTGKPKTAPKKMRRKSKSGRARRKNAKKKTSKALSRHRPRRRAV